MSVTEIVLGTLLIISCLIVIVLCMMQDTKSQDSMTSAITGSSADSFYGKNTGRTKEAMLIKTTRVFAIILFVITLASNILPVIISNMSD